MTKRTHGGRPDSAAGGLRGARRSNDDAWSECPRGHEDRSVRTEGNGRSGRSWVATGAAIWATAAALGVQALFERVGLSPRLLQLAGGAYLIWLGLRLWTSTLGRHDVPHPPTLSHTSRVSPYLVGLFTNLSNPKSLIFVGSVFASILGPQPSTTLRVAGFC